MRGMPQAEKAGNRRRGTREFTGTSMITVFVRVYALVAEALAQACPLQHAPGLVQALCYDAALGMARIVPVMPLIRCMQEPDPRP